MHYQKPQVAAFFYLKMFLGISLIVYTAVLACLLRAGVQGR